jgi:hypothetical protein
MKLQENPVKIERGGQIVESMFGISEEDSAHILLILRNKLYSNKVLAVVREYCANAQDAHAEVGKTDIPIEVYLPNSLEPTFRVRDYGPGLSEDEVRNLYVMYGASTKRATNNAVGQLGLGCKSAFAYTDVFHVISWHGGEKKIYCAYIDETKCGKIALLESEKSDEPDGIEVQVPVQPGEYKDFYEEAEEILHFFDPVPKCDQITLEAPDYWLEGTTRSGARFGITKGYDSNSKVIMGGIPYPINRQAYKDDDQGKLERFIQTGLHLYVNIGDLEMTANREELEYTDHTVKNLTKHLSQAANAALRMGTKHLSEAMTYREANIRLAVMANDRQFWKMGKRQQQWCGKSIDGMVIPPDSRVTIYYPYQTARGAWRWNETGSINARENVILFDIDNKQNWKRKVAEFVSHHNLSRDYHTKIYALLWQDSHRTAAENRASIYAERQLDEYAPYRASKCKVPASARAKLKTQGLGPRSTSHIGKIFVLKAESHRTRSRRCRSKDWERVTEVPAETKYYVELDKFYPRFNGKSSTLTVVDSLVLLMGMCGLKVGKVYGVKKAQLCKLDDSWEPLLDAADDAISESSLLQQAVDLEECLNLPEPVKHTIPYLDKLPKGSPAHKLVYHASKLVRVSDYIRPCYDSIRCCREFLGTSVSMPSTTLEPLIDAAAERYPLSAMTNVFPDDSCSNWYRRFHRGVDSCKALPHVIKYIQLVENCHNKERKR